MFRGPSANGTSVTMTPAGAATWGVGMRWTGARLATLLAVMVIIGVGVWAWKSGADVGSNAAPIGLGGVAGDTATAAKIAPGEAVPAATAAASRGASADPLPTLQTPLRLSLPELERRAAAGEPKAACRLAAEFAYCAQLRTQLAGVEQMMERELTLRQPDAPGSEASAGMHARRKYLVDMAKARADDVLRETAHCDDVAAAQPATIARHWRAAALGGHVASMRHYAVGNAFRISDTLENLPALALYRTEAESIARRAVDAGDARTIAALAAAYSPLNDGSRRTYLAQAVRPNVVESLALYMQLRAASGPESDGSARMITARIAQLSRIASPQQIALAQSRSAQRKPVSPVGLSPYTLSGGGLEDVSREECTDDALSGIDSTSVVAPRDF